MIDRRRGRVAVAIALSLAACARAEPPASTVIYAAASAPGPAATATARAGVATPRLALTGLAGRLVAEAIAGDASRFDVFARLKHRAFPGGALLRTPALVLGMAWYRLRDMLG